MSLAELIHKKPPVAVATAIPAISATHGQERAGTVARIATVAVASPTEAQNDNGNSSRNSKNSSSKPCEQKTKSRSWLLHFADRNPLTVACLPAASHAEVLDAYPDALAAEPIEPGQRQPGAPLAGDKEAAIRAWLAQIGETDEATIDDVLRQCRHDEEARQYFLGRAGCAVTDDDRRRCSQCRNLRGAVCVVARPGGLVSAIVGYRPASPGVLQRCASYSPNASDTDPRPGRERWPGLIQKGIE